MQPFVVRLTGLKAGVTRFDWRAELEFFESFGNTDIVGAGLDIAVELRHHGLTVDVNCDIVGSVTVPCDRCLGDLEMPVRTSFEETYSPEGGELDLSQDIYDYVCTCLPLQRVHPEGECDQETTKFLSK